MTTPIKSKVGKSFAKAAVYLAQLVSEYALGQPEVSTGLNTNGTMVTVVEKLLAHKKARDAIVAPVKAADLFELLWALVEEPEQRKQLVGSSSAEKALVDWAHRRGLTMTRKNATHLLTGTPHITPRKSGPQEVLAARMQDVFGTKRDMLLKHVRARKRPISDRIAVRTPEEFQRALERPAPSAVSVALIMTGLGYSESEVAAALTAAGHHPEEVKFACRPFVADSATATEEAP